MNKIEQALQRAKQHLNDPYPISRSQQEGAAMAIDDAITASQGVEPIGGLDEVLAEFEQYRAGERSNFRIGIMEEAAKKYLELTRGTKDE